jgi:hypothetical protein
MFNCVIYGDVCIWIGVMEVGSGVCGGVAANCCATGAVA